MVYDIGGKLSLQGTPVYYSEMFYFIRLGELAKTKDTYDCALLHFVKHSSQSQSWQFS